MIRATVRAATPDDMEAFEDWAAGQDCNGVALATRAAAPSYERLGYTSRAAYLKKYFRSEPAAG